MEVALFVLLLLAFVVLLIYAIATAIEYEKQIDEEEKEKEKQKQKQEYINSTLCIICKNHSYGNNVCQNCKDRAEILNKEIPKRKISNFDNTHEYYIEIKNKLLSSNNDYERETNSIKLFGISKYLYNKYQYKTAAKETDELFLKIKNDNYVIISPQTNQTKTTTNNKQYQNNKTDYRKKYNATLRCEDGKYVRSKAEREIANFFFRNNIRYIYEDEYYCVQRDKVYYPDFFLPDYYLIIEYFGRTDPEYINKKNEKIEVYKQDPNLKFEYLDQNNDYDLISALKKICIKHNIPIK